MCIRDRLSPDGGDEDDAFSTSITDSAPLLALYRAIEERLEEGELDSRIPVVVTASEQRVDFGMIAHLFEALAYRRELGEIETDLELLLAPVINAGGEPERLIPSGLLLLAN